jgi:hypothetical protein
MFALLALISFILALFDAPLGSLDMVTLGLVFVALHLLFGGWAPWGSRVRRSQ